MSMGLPLARTVLVLVACFLSRPLFAVTPEQAIVRIVAKLNGGPTSVGTGTVVSSDGKILTCYHVIRDSREINISFVGRKDDLKAHVVSIAPEYDLALLKLDGASGTGASYPTKVLDPSAFAGLQAESEGYPANTSYDLAAISVTALNSHYFLSSQLRSENGTEELFTRPPDRQLIIFTTVVDNGTSGSPLLFQGNVVGVISGSWSIHGSDAWAIPMKYLSNLRAPTAAELQPGHWPPVNMLKNNAEFSRSSLSLSAPVIIALGQFAHSMEQLKTVCSPLRDDVPKVKSMLQDRLDKADTAVKAFGADALASEHPGIGTTVDLDLQMMLLRLFPCTQAFNDVHADGDALTNEVNSFSAALAGEPKQRARISPVLQETKSEVKKVTNIVDALDHADSDFIYREPPNATVADYRSAFQNDVDFMRTRDPAGLYARAVAELETYYDIVNRLVAASK